MTPRLTVSRKVFLLLLLPLIFLLVFVWAVTDLKKVSASRTAALTRTKDVISLTLVVLRDLEIANTEMDQYALARDTRHANASRRSLREVEPATSRLLHMLSGVGDAAQTAAAERLHDTSRRLVIVLGRLQTAVASGDGPAIVKASDEAAAALDSLHARGQDLLQLEQILEERSEGALQHQWSTVDAALVWGAGLAALLSLLLGWLLGNSVSKRLTVVAQNARQVADSLPLLPPVGGDDEIGVLDGAFHSMAEALERASGRERALMKNVADVICSFDRQGRFTAVSPAAHRMFGYAPAELVGHSWIDLMIPAQEVDAVRRALAAIDQAGASTSIDTLCRRRDEHLVSVVWNVTWSAAEQLIYAVARDVTDRKAAESERQFYLETIDRLDEAVFELDGACVVRQMSSAWQSLSGLPVESALGKPLAGYAHEGDREQLEGVLRSVLSGEEHVSRMRFRLSLADGGEAWVDSQLLPHRDAYGAIAGVRGVLRDVTQSYLQELRIAKLALHDPLTHLPNRALLDDRLQVALAMARRTRLRVALAFIDVDNFKQINDQLGHAAGDQVLKKLAVGLSGELRKGDTLARWGGDEFVVLLPDLARDLEVSVIAQRLLGAAASSDEVKVTLSIGIALFPDHAETAEELMKAADRAMFRAKHSGRNNFQIVGGGSVPPEPRRELPVG